MQPRTPVLQSYSPTVLQSYPACHPMQPRTPAQCRARSSAVFSRAAHSPAKAGARERSYADAPWTAELNLHLPSILATEAGKSAVEAASIYSIYNGCAIGGKVFVGIVFSTPALKRSLLVYVPCPALYCLAHFLLLDVAPAPLVAGDLLGAFTVTSSTWRLQLFCAVVGSTYGFVASLLHLLVREFFGLVDLSRLQPIVFGAMIVGEMGGMALPGIMYDAYGTYSASLLVSLGSTVVTFACFLVMLCEHPLEAASKPSDPPRGATSELL